MAPPNAEALARFERLRRRADHLFAVISPLNDREQHCREQIARAMLALRDAAQGRPVEVDEDGHAFHPVSIPPGRAALRGWRDLGGSPLRLV